MAKNGFIHSPTDLPIENPDSVEKNQDFIYNSNVAQAGPSSLSPLKRTVDTTGISVPTFKDEPPASAASTQVVRSISNPMVPNELMTAAHSYFGNRHEERAVK